jgi:hypothetical protein
MRLLKLSMYLLIILAIAKITSGSKPHVPSDANYENIISYRPAPLLNQEKGQQETDFDSTAYLNHFSNLSLKQKALYPEMPKHKHDFNFSFIVF